MTRRVTVTQAKASLDSFISEVETGEDIEITMQGKTVAKLIGSRPAKPSRGWLRGIARTNTSDEELFSSSDWNG